jgi:Type II CAAX prenyl endopeptidase Rce1-like
MQLLQKFDYVYFTQNRHNQSFKNKIITFRNTFFACIFGLIISTVVVLIFDSICRLVIGHNLISPILKYKIATAQSDNFSPWITVLFAPIFEEIENRLFLNLKKYAVAISLGCMFFFYSGPVWYLNNGDFNFVFFIRIAATIAIMTSIYLYLPIRLLLYLKSNFQYVFLFSALLFGYGHIMNFAPLTIKVILLSPILVLTQIIYGLALGYLRMKNGILWSISLHISINALAYFTSH